MWKEFKQIVYRALVPLIRYKRLREWKLYLNSSEQINIVVGAGTTEFKGWFSTDIDTLNLLKEEDFKKYFPQKKINRVLAEHVYEHLSEADIITAMKNIHKYSEDAVTVRVAVPDGYHNDPAYIERVRPGGTGAGAHDHKHLFTYKSLGELCNKAGFEGKPVEYFDENKVFHQGYQNDERGIITRSFVNDDRNINGVPRYTSLIMDFTKKR